MTFDLTDPLPFVLLLYVLPVAVGQLVRSVRTGQPVKQSDLLWFGLSGLGLFAYVVYASAQH